MAKLILVDETQVDIQSDYIIVDDTYEFNTSVADYTALAQLSDKLNDENMATVKMVDPFNNEVIYRNLTMASPRFIIVKENDFEIVVTLRMKEKSEQVAQMDTIVEVAQRFDDEQALRVKSIYPQWDTLVGKTVPIDTKFNWYDVLYKTKQPDMLIQKQYQPGTIGTESLYECIDETHKGTYEDPIPYSGNMTLEKGKFYTQNGIIYACTNGSGIAVYDRLEYLTTFVTEYVDAAGTLGDPIKWFGGGLAIEEGKYYIQDGKVYVAIASSEIPVYGDLSALATYVKEYIPEPTIEPGETPENPIPYEGGIALEYNKYYIQDGVVYICIVATEGPVDTPLNELTDNVLKYEVDAGEPEEPDDGGDKTEPTGDSADDPIPWVVGSKLYKGQYYIDKDVVYLCIRDSGIEMSFNLADLISGGFVQVVEPSSEA